MSYFATLILPLQLFVQKNWKLILRFTGAEMISILLTAVSGFLMIQHLSKDTYGVYGFLITGVTLITGLSEIGINHCFLPLVGYTNVTYTRIQAVMSLFVKRRFRLLLVSSLLVLPVLGWLMYQNHWLNISYSLTILLMLIGAYLAVQEQLQRQKYTAMHESKLVSKATFFSSIVRTTWIIISLNLFSDEAVLLAFLSISGGVGSVIALWIYNGVNNKLEASDINTGEPIDLNKLDIELDHIYKPLRLPAFLYILYASFGSIAIGWFGNTITMADVNASGRLTMGLILMDRLSGIFIMPKLSQAPSSDRYVHLVLKALVIYISIVVLVILSAYFFPEAWLLLIGEKYMDLKNILWMAFLGTILTNMSGFIFTCLTSRGYTSNQLPILIVGILSQFVVIYFIGLHTPKDVFIVNIISASIFAGGNLFLLLYKIKQLKAMEPELNTLS